MNIICFKFKNLKWVSGIRVWMDSVFLRNVINQCNQIISQLNILFMVEY